MGVIFDILGSFVVRAAIVVTILNLMITLNEALYKKTDQAYLNEVISAPAQILTEDLKLAGYGASTTFPIANANEVSFYADTDNNGSAETIRYYVDSQILYRTIDGGTPFEVARQVVSFTFVYFNVTGAQISYGLNRTTVKSIYVQITLQSQNLFKNMYSGTSDTTKQSAIWQSHIFPVNL